MQNIFGFLNINKPPDCTSHDIIAMLRRSLGIKKIGHSGTLDPFSTGVLVIGINEATRLFEYLPQDKSYIAEVTFGIGTNTHDITGDVIEKSEKIPSKDEIENELGSFIGKVKQKPPIFSAIKINGERAYRLARKKQITPDIVQEKEIEIYSIEIVSYLVETHRGVSLLRLKIHCSRGTYIRSLARDLGRKLNTCATLSSLKRISIGNIFTYEQSIEPQFVDKTTLFEYLISPLKVLTLSKINLNSNEVEDITHGKLIKANKEYLNCSTSELQLLDNNNKLVAIGSLVDGCIIKPEKVLIRQ